MSTRCPTVQHEVVAALPTAAARRSAARAVWPGTARLVDAAVERPAAVRKVPAAAMFEAMLCVWPDQRRALVDADRRSATTTAFMWAQCHATATDRAWVLVGATPCRLVDGTTVTVAEALAALDDAPERGTAALDALLAALDASYDDPSLDVADDVVELWDRVADGTVATPRRDSLPFGTVVGNPRAPELLGRLAPLGLDAMSMAAAASPSVPELSREMWDHLRFDPAAVDELADRLASTRDFRAAVSTPLSRPGLRMLDRLFGHDCPELVVAAVEECSRHERARLTPALCELSPAVLQVLAVSVAEHRLDPVADADVLRAMHAAGVPMSRLHRRVTHGALLTWLELCDDEDLARWAARKGALDQAHALARSRAASDRVADALVGHNPSLLTRIVEGAPVWAPVHERALGLLATAVGEDEEAWAVLWALAPGWTATVPDAAEVALASVSDPGRLTA